MNTTTHTYYQRSDSIYSDQVNIAPIVVGTVGAVVFITLAAVVTRHLQKRRGEENRSADIGQETGNAQVGIWGTRTESNNTAPTTRTGRNRQQTQNSTRNLPVYNEQAPDGEVVLLERVKSRSTTENDEGAGAITIRTSVDNMEANCARTPALDTPGVTANASSTHGHVPTYEEATTVTDHTANATEVRTSSTQAEQR